MRAAVYFTPPAGSPLARTAAEWLGRNPFDGEATRAPDPEIDPLIAAPTRYGFHATIVAPFRFAPGIDLEAVDQRLAEFCASRDAVTIPAVTIARLGRFFALVPAEPSTKLDDLAGSAVRAFSSHRAKLDENEIARRRPETLSERQRAYLGEWGYPYVFEDFRFHMTLTGPVTDDEAETVQERLTTRFADFEGQPLVIDQLAIFIEPQPGEPFRVHSVHRFGE
ncbi:DUF1045 domain-containing protein [Jiella marina]|uniref:DUF1045 domain-containing protein n=1 Tax=Jiella sp. LLJ827 TaxID=2917712 RepID=UPI0021015FA0|nr:DUF1045 domain-containing protein [Jiella sp. LLJ827]MCQ0988639.1 DUF1045 domain-containing protein [Jiella sp. LLJ827]